MAKYKQRIVIDIQYGSDYQMEVHSKILNIMLGIIEQQFTKPAYQQNAHKDNILKIKTGEIAKV